MTTDRAAFEAALDLLILYVAGDIEEEAEEASTEAAEARKSTLALYDTLAAERDAARPAEAEAMALVIAHEGRIEALTAEVAALEEARSATCAACGSEIHWRPTPEVIRLTAENEQLWRMVREIGYETAWRDRIHAALTPLSDAEREARRPRPPGLGALHGAIAPQGGDGQSDGNPRQDRGRCSKGGWSCC
jgi:hypothetical protein